MTSIAIRLHHHLRATSRNCTGGTRRVGGATGGATFRICAHTLRLLFNRLSLLLDSRWRHPSPPQP